MFQPVEIEGLRQFTKQLKSLDTEAPKALRIAFNDATGLVIDYAKPLIPRRTGRAVGTVKAKSTQTSARVSAGGNRAPYYPWLDFGGKVGRNRSVERPFFKEGRFLWKALIVKRGELQGALEDAIVTAAERAGFEVT